MLYLVHTVNNGTKSQCDFKTTKFPTKELLANYLKNNPNLVDNEYLVLEGDVLHSKGRYIYDGRFQ